MEKTENRFDQILLENKRSLNKAKLQYLALILVVVISFWLVGFFSLERLADGIPAILTLFGEMLPPDFSKAGDWIAPLIDTVFMSIAGTALSIFIAFPFSILAARNTSPNGVVYFISRTILNCLRAVPELIMGIIFVAAVGFGALPGVLALGLHSAGMVGKFFAESIEHAAIEPIEAAQSTGTSAILVIWYGVIPQVFSQMADVCIYRWEYNFRASTVMGMVGAGGIGFELIASLRILEYQEVFAILLVILAMVTIIDYIGGRLRKALN